LNIGVEMDKLRCIWGWYAQKILSLPMMQMAWKRGEKANAELAQF
jgi:hypothetical protein